ncbi:MAG: hypothetical protein NUW22_12435 [Acidobacteria bacterium]|nr:hypothetical protein [Acidobacteriota bacterium]
MTLSLSQPMHEASPQPDGDSRSSINATTSDVAFHSSPTFTRLVTLSAEDAYQRAIDEVAFALIRAAARRVHTMVPVQPRAIPGWETFRVAACKALAWTDSGAKGAAMANTILDIAEADDVDVLESRDAQLVRRAIQMYEAHLTQQGELVGRS